MEVTLPYNAVNTVTLALAAVVVPLVAALVNLLALNRQSKASAWVSTFAVIAALLLSALVFTQVWNKPALHLQQQWFTVGGIKVQAGVWLNNLSVLLLLLVSAIAVPVHIYSMAYMKGDERYTRYFGYLSFFCSAMFGLVIADSLLLLYAFWELVGFASYLLIGFWFTRARAVQANKKAFIMNRIGDVGLLIGILLIYSHYHTFDMPALFGGSTPLASANSVNGGWLTLPGICLLCGALAKSAQFPLHTWLPDAMEGPTSVSALIHAATMVAAGIFLLGRVYPVFTPGVLTLIACIGCFTAFMAATIALTQNDLKRILAYSTISQLGFMMLAMGVGAYSSSLFHLATHAFFKCLLFLSAGAIIHEMNHLNHKYQLAIDPQNIQYMGGLRKLMPVTFITCTVAALALIGFPFTSGYLSKDAILIQAFEWAQGKSWQYAIIPTGAMLTSLLTVFYIARLMFRVFLGQSRLKQINPDVEAEAHEGDWRLSLPMVFLSLCSLFPLFAFNPFAYRYAWLVKGFTAPALTETAAGQTMLSAHLVIPVAVNLLGLLVIYLAYRVYVRQNVHWFKQQGWLYNISFNQWYLDRFYTGVIIWLVTGLGRILYWLDKHVLDGLVNLLAALTILLSKVAAIVDRYIIDGLLHLLAGIVKQAGNFIRGFQTGRVQGYVLTMLFIILIVYVLKTFI